MSIKAVLRPATVVLGFTALAAAGVTVSSPANGATVGSPVRVVASASASRPITAIKVYVDSRSVYSTSASKIDTSISMSSGTRYVTVQAWDSGGYVYKSSLKVYVSGTTSSGSTSGSTTSSAFYNIDSMSGWGSCDKCSGPGGDGYSTPHSTSLTSSPALDGIARKFWLGGDVAYSSALWWKDLTPKDSARYFKYEVSFYFKDYNAVQALEFDVNQLVNGWKHIFGTECNVRNQGTIKVWEAARTYAKGGQWRSTGIPCTIKAWSWNTIVWEFQRLDNGYVKYIAVTLNGKKYYVNRTYTAEPNSYRKLTTSFQMDGNYQMKDYTVWLDKVHLKYW